MYVKGTPVNIATVYIRGALLGFGLAIMPHPPDLGNRYAG